MNQKSKLGVLPGPIRRSKSGGSTGFAMSLSDVPLVKITDRYLYTLFVVSG